MTATSSLPIKVSRLALCVMVYLLVISLGTHHAFAVHPASDADFNGDGVVNEGDLAIWSSGFALQSGGDADGDGDVDIDDLFIWKTQEGGPPPLTSPLATGDPEVLYNPTTGALSIVPHGFEIYALFLSLNGSHVSNVSNTELPGSGAWDMRNFSSSIQGYDTSMLIYSSPVQNDFTLDQISNQAKIADLVLGLSASDFGSLRYGLTDDTVGNAILIIVPEPTTFALTALGLLGIGWRRRKRA